MSPSRCFLVVALIVALVPVGAASEPDGQGVFTTARCNVCHSVASRAIARTSKMRGSWTRA